MREPLYALAALVAAAGAAAAQQTAPIKVITTTSAPAAVATTAPAAPAAAAVSPLDAHLRLWEAKMRDVQTLEAKLGRSTKDKVFGTTAKSEGMALYMKAGSGATALNLASLTLKEAGKAEANERIVCTGTYLYQFWPAQKEIRAYPIPRPKPGQVGDDSFLGFLFGMKAEDAKKRYDMSLFKVDPYYVYIDVKPLHPSDKSDFTSARLVLHKDSYLPRQLWFREANGNEIIWDIPSIKPGVSIDRREFDAPRPPAGWKVVPVAANGAGAAEAPRVIRK